MSIRRTSPLFSLAAFAGLGVTWLFTSAFQVPCFAFCTDQTNIQENYVKSRDECREFAELKADIYNDPASPEAAKQRKTRLVGLFSDCMGAKGWTVPGPTADPKDKDAKPGDKAAPDAAAVAAAATAKRDLQRSAECAYARQAENNTATAASQAKGCDEECTQRLRMAPEAPLPASCPPEGSARLRLLKADAERAGPPPGVIAAPIITSTSKASASASASATASAKPASSKHKKSGTKKSAAQKPSDKTAAPAKPSAAKAAPAPASTPKPATPPRSGSPEAVLEQGLHLK